MCNWSILLLVLPPRGVPAAVHSFAFCVQHDHITGGATQPLHHSTSSSLSTWATCNTSPRETVRAVEHIHHVVGRIAIKSTGRQNYNRIESYHKEGKTLLPVRADNEQTRTAQLHLFLYERTTTLTQSGCTHIAMDRRS